MNKSISPSKRKASLLLVSSLALGFPLSAQATDLCGQIITADTKLDEDQRCSGNGITIGADNIALNCDGHSLSGPGTPLRGGPPTIGIALNGRKGVTVKNCNVTGFARAGILLSNSSHNKIINNDAPRNSTVGISLTLSSHNKLGENTANGNRAGGIVLQGSSYNKLTENTATANGDLEFPGGSVIFSASGISLFSSSHNRLIDNTANDNQAHGILLIQSSDRNRLTDNTADGNARDGIELEDSSRNKLRDNVANNNGGAGASGSPSAGFAIEGSSTKN
ncbi:MAG: right-handed parallel beta-helix repeat-containing protein, partial [Burkholderiales bacterium]|nr:right-handed parallel beta-helix repeat-containing protein [Burkholderiales bacterium]